MAPHESAAAKEAREAAERDAVLYNKNLSADIETDVNEAPRALVHSREWAKIMRGDPVEINPAVGFGYKIMSVAEWSSRWKRNDDFPDCLSCGSLNTKAHHFIQASARPGMLPSKCPFAGQKQHPLLACLRVSPVVEGNSVCRTNCATQRHQGGPVFKRASL